MGQAVVDRVAASCKRKRKAWIIVARCANDAFSLSLSLSLSLSQNQ